VSFDLGFGGVGKVTIRPNNDVVQIAHQVWTELVTRKAGLEFDAEHDLIVEVYDSWYQLFGRIRESLRIVPAHRLRSDEHTRVLIDVLIKALNNGLRPHLTRWQARFRAWYGLQLKEEKNRDRAPQEIQQEFKDYKALIEDLRQANRELVQLAKALQKIAQGE
jgi:DNA-directed RNA polymerase specialized sigma54-like protein